MTRAAAAGAAMLGVLALAGAGWWSAFQTATEPPPEPPSQSELAGLMATDASGASSPRDDTSQKAAVEPPIEPQPIGLEAETGIPAREHAEVPVLVLPENDPRALLDLVSNLLNRDEFVDQAVESQVLVEMPNPVTINRPVAEAAYWTLVHGLAGLMYQLRPEMLALDPRLASMKGSQLRVEILKSILPVLPGLLREKKVTMSMMAKGGEAPAHGELRGQSSTMAIHPSYERITLTFRRGPWAVKMVIPGTVVQPELWASWVLEQQNEMRAKR